MNHPANTRDALLSAGLSEKQCDILVGMDLSGGTTAAAAAAVRQALDETVDAAVYKSLLLESFSREQALRATVADLRLQLQAALAASQLREIMGSEYNSMTIKLNKQHKSIEILKDIISIISMNRQQSEDLSEETMADDKKQSSPLLWL